MTEDSRNRRRFLPTRRQFLFGTAGGIAAYTLYSCARDRQATRIVEELRSQHALPEELLDSVALDNGTVTVFDGGVIVSGRKDFPRNLAGISDLAWEDVKKGKLSNLSRDDIRHMMEEPPMEVEKALGRMPMRKGEPYAIIRMDK